MGEVIDLKTRKTLSAEKLAEAFTPSAQEARIALEELIHNGWPSFVIIGVCEDDWDARAIEITVADLAWALASYHQRTIAEEQEGGESEE